MLMYAATIFLGAFLLFLVQPIIAKQILPWFGGSAAVWATCMVFFQMSLLLGYAYADLTTRKLGSRRQMILHLVLLAVSLLALPIVPDVSWKPAGDENPSWRILGLLAVTIGLPYFMLSSTSPLLQAWYARRYNHALPYRLFALSNLASLLALLSYPVLVEPWISTVVQSWAWSAGYVAFALLCGVAAVAGARQMSVAPASEAQLSAGDEGPPGFGRQLTWMLLAGTATMLLLAVTNHICQNIASLPFLWILPLSIYLASFIFCFDHPRWYHRKSFLLLVAVMLPAMAWYSSSLALKVAIPVYLAGLFACCMFCHGELTLLKPAPRYLTTFYLMISLGGALGGLLVGLVAPYVLIGYFELGFALVLATLLLLRRTWRMAWWVTPVAAAVAVGTAWGAVESANRQIENTRVMVRNFYGVVKTKQYNDPVAFRTLVHAGINHGGQFQVPERKLEASSYFAANSGIGMMFANYAAAPRKVGVLGLGAGAIIAHARAGDIFRFYEINPQVVDLAHTEFSFVADTPAKIDIVLGDGRLSLEREASQQFDILVIDAFSGDSIPLHLLTREAIATYLRHLKPGGVLAFQATNRFIDISPVVASLAGEHGLTAIMITGAEGSEDAADYWTSATDQILVTANPAFLAQPQIHEQGKTITVPAGFRVWTDTFNNLIGVLR